MSGLQVTEEVPAVSNSADDVGHDDTTEPVEPETPPVPTPAHHQYDGAPPSSAASSRQVSLSVRTLITSVVILMLVAGVGVMTWLYLGERNTVQAQQSQAANYQHAEQIALDYAVNAATMNFHDSTPGRPSWSTAQPRP